MGLYFEEHDVEIIWIGETQYMCHLTDDGYAVNPYTPVVFE